MLYIWHIHTSGWEKVKLIVWKGMRKVLRLGFCLFVIFLECSVLSWNLFALDVNVVCFPVHRLPAKQFGRGRPRPVQSAPALREGANALWRLHVHLPAAGGLSAGRHAPKPRVQDHSLHGEESRCRQRRFKQQHFREGVGREVEEYDWCHLHTETIGYLQ